MHRLSPQACGFALGGTCAIGLLAFAVISMIAGDYGRTIISLMSSVYVGYAATIPGAILGAIWGFVDGFIGGFVFAWLYNKALEMKQ